MFTRADLSTVLDAAPSPAVSIFMPTHVRGDEVRQGPIRLKNLAAEAKAGLAAAGLPAAEIERIVGPALTLVEDHEFWQHRDQGLALFLDAGGARRFTVPIPLAEDVAVGTGFRVRPLLPVLAADGAFLVVTVTADAVRVLDASRFAVTGTDLPGGPDGPDGSVENDYENPVQASPPARPHTGTANISHAQVYGDSPPEWRKTRLVEYVRKVAAAVERRLAADPVPVVLVADTEIAGHFRKAADLGPPAGRCPRRQPRVDGRRPAARSGVRRRATAPGRRPRRRGAPGRGPPRATGPPGHDRPPGGGRGGAGGPGRHPPAGRGETQLQRTLHSHQGHYASPLDLIRGQRHRRAAAVDPAQAHHGPQDRRPGS